MAGLFSRLVFLVALLSACAPALGAASSFSSFWNYKLPLTPLPTAMAKLASPLSDSRAQKLLAQWKAGTAGVAQASRSHGFCSSAGIYCPQKAMNPVSGAQPRVCFPPFIYEYGVLPCPHPHAAGASEAMFFSQSSLAVGQRVQLPSTANDLEGRRFLPQSLAQALPEMKRENLRELSKVYGVEAGTEMELEMENTLAHCSRKSDHEVKACLASGEGMVDFVSKAMGQNVSVYAPTATRTQEATVVDIARVGASQGAKVASCHDMKFPSLLYSCHITQTSEVLQVSLRAAHGRIMRLPAICHKDTSYWNPSHVAFKMLNVKPGKSSVCHWFPENSFVFVQS